MSSTNFNIEYVKNDFRNSITKYFGNPVMTKLRELSNGYSIYYAKVGCMLCVEDRYILCFIRNDNEEIFTNMKLSSLQWVSFQTRTIEQLEILTSDGMKKITLKTQEKPTFTDKNILDKIYQTEKKSDRNVYSFDIQPVKVELLYTESDTEYSNSGTLQTALETFNCVLTFLI